MSGVPRSEKLVSHPCPYMLPFQILTNAPMKQLLVSIVLILTFSGCVGYGAGNHKLDVASDETHEAIESLKPYQRVWAVTQGAKPIREEFGSDCLVALNVYYTTVVTDHLLVLRNSAAMEMGGFLKKRVVMFDTVIHSRAGESIDLPHQVRLAIQEREFGVVTFQKLYIGLDVVPGEAKNPIDDRARADATEFRRQYGKVCEDKHI